MFGPKHRLRMQIRSNFILLLNLIANFIFGQIRWTRKYTGSANGSANHMEEASNRIEPAHLEEVSEEHSDARVELSAASATLGKSLHPRTAANLADFVRIMNSNLIEGHDTRPRDIERALAGNFDKMLFAHLKRVLRCDRLRLRGPNGAKDEFLLAATAQNLRKLAEPIPMNEPVGATGGGKALSNTCPTATAVAWPPRRRRVFQRNRRYAAAQTLLRICATSAALSCGRNRP